MDLPFGESPEKTKVGCAGARVLFVMLGLAFAGLFPFASLVHAACSNPSPLPAGYASPCPVFSVSPASVPQTGTETLSASPQPGTDYIYTTAYYSEGSGWTPLTLNGNNVAPSYSSGPASGSIGASILSTLVPATRYVVLWDWLWDATAGCYKGPGLNRCNTGTWRVQEFTLTPAMTGQTIFTTQTPDFTNVNNGVNYELGTRFSSNVAGTITAIRFWKDSYESGIHIGRLWDVSGNLLTSVTFANETASGWQQQSLSTPFTIAANTTYTVSVNTTNNFFVYSLIGTKTPVVNGNLQTIPGDYGVQVAGANGIYPGTSSHNNFFRDLVFVTSLATSPTPTPTLTPTPTPTPVAGSCTGPFTVLNPPPVSCRPYPSAYFNKKLPNAGAGGPTNHLMPSSDAVVSTIFTSSAPTSYGGALATTPGQQDEGLGTLYYGQSTDPVYQVTGCTGPSTSIAVNGLKFHAPSAAPYSQGSTDEEIQIWDQPTNTVFAFYWGAGGSHTLPVCSGTTTSPCSFNSGNGYCSAMNYSTGSGVNAGNGGSSVGNGPLGNEIRQIEFESGHINHGLRVYTLCTGTDNGLYPAQVVYPADQTSGGPAYSCASAGLAVTNRPPNGALFFLDYTQAQLDCFNPAKAVCAGINKLAPIQYMLVEAMSLYGATLEGTSGYFSLNIGIFKGESEQPYVFYETHGYPGAQTKANTFTNYMNTHCISPTCQVATRSPSPPYSAYTWNTYTWRGISNVNGTGITSHMHIADPCVTKALQGVSGGCQ